jgi:uncharacterized protein DUF2834
MTLSRRALCIAYALIAIVALVATWGNNIAYLDQGFIGANVAFWRDTLANPASRSITADLFWFGLAVFIWMILEAKRLGMRGVWIYLVLGFLVAVSVTVPVFLLNRERTLAARESSQVAGTLHPGDIGGLLLLAAGFLAYSVIALR